MFSLFLSVNSYNPASVPIRHTHKLGLGVHFTSSIRYVNIHFTFNLLASINKDSSNYKI